MLRSDLVRQALQAGRNAEHNLQVIARNPDKMIDPNKLCQWNCVLEQHDQICGKRIGNEKRPPARAVSTEITTNESLGVYFNRSVSEAQGD